jgi:hypothetical protein
MNEIQTWTEIADALYRAGKLCECKSLMWYINHIADAEAIELEKKRNAYNTEVVCDS